MCETPNLLNPPQQSRAASQCPLRSAWGRELTSIPCCRAVAGAGAATLVPWAQPCCEEPGPLAWSSDGLGAHLGPVLLIKIIIQLNVLLLLQASSFLLPC